MITLELSCSQCGTELRDQLVVDNLDKLTCEELRDHLEMNGWIMEENGKHLDIYCSKKCAK